jgi:DnaK suppressor protein
MDKGNVQRFKTILEFRQQELRLSIQHQRQSARTAGREADAVDHATTSSERELLLQQRNREQGLLRMVEAALERIRDGSFGQCISCGNEIEVKRLQAVPWTRYCIQCQEDFER